MSDLANIIARLEKATSPDRAIDAEIHFDVLGHKRDVQCEHCGTFSFSIVPAYTQSIDTALTLLPEGMVVAVTTEGDALAAKPHDYWTGDLASGFHESGATAAIAVCIASLKARPR